MKTTINIADPILVRSKELAAREGITLRELIERALTDALNKQEVARSGFRLRDASVSGTGLHPGIDWELPRDLAYDEAP